MPKHPVPSPGDVYVRKHADGRYGAVRVLRVVDKSILLSTTDYLADHPPMVPEDRLRRPVEQHRFFYQGQRAICWLRGSPPPNFTLVFNLPLSNDEALIECNSYGGSWHEGTGLEVFMEWRWNHDREALEHEVQEDRVRSEQEQRRAALAQRPKRMLAEDTFWSLIDLLDWSNTGDDESVLEPLVSALSGLGKPSIRSFAERLAFCLYSLDTKGHAQHIGVDSFINEAAHFSSDGFLYARCAAVANGRAFYTSVLIDPRRMPKDIEFEALLSAAPTAWERITGEYLDHQAGCSYETFSNISGWSSEAP
jgi:hypothetical protein